MSEQPGTRQLDAENQDLRARLDKAESTLREVLGGEADAIFISGMDGAQLFTLKDADRSYRTLIENMSEGALTLTPEGLVLYANQRFVQMLGTSLEKVIGAEIHHWFAPESRQVIKALLQKKAIDNHREELNLAAADGTQVPVYLSVSRLVLNEIDSVCMVVTDLTEQKRTDAFLTAEKLSNAILDQAADAIVICDNNGRIMRASKKTQEFCSESPVGQLFDRAFSLRHADGSAFSSIDSIDAEHGLSTEAMLNCDGRDCNLLVSVGRLMSARGELLGSVVTLTDITERKAAEIALRTSEGQLSEALTIARMGYWAYEVATDEFTFNDQYYLLHNITVADAGGYRISRADYVRRYVSPDTAAVMAEDMQLAMTSKDPHFSKVTEARLLNGNGETVWVEVRYGIEMDSQGNTAQLFGIVQNIDDRKQSEQKLSENKGLLNSIVNSAMDAILTVDDAQRVKLANPAAEKLFGYSAAEFSQLSLSSLIPERSRAGHPGLVAAFGKSGLASRRMSKAQAVTGLRKSGEEFPIEVTISRDNSTGRWIYNAILRDVSERYKAEEEIKFKNSMLLTQLETSLDAILVVAESGNIISYNQHFIDMWQLSPQMVSAGVDDPVLEAVARLQVNAKAFVARVKYLYEHREDKSRDELQLKDGRVIDRYSSPVTGVDGLHYGRIWYFRDVTERKRAELALRTSELRFKTMFEQAPLGIAKVGSLDGRVYEANPRYAEIIGRTMEEVENIHWMEFTHPDDVQADLDNMALLIAGKISGYQMEKRYTRPDGTVAWVDMTISPLKAEDKAHPSHLCMIQDITERQQAELQLHESERRFTDLLGNVELISMMLDREARITYCNDYLLRLTGWQREEIIGKSWWQIFVPPEVQYLKGAFFSSLLDNRPESMHHENDIVTRSGERRLIRWNNTVLRSGAGDVIGSASIGEDISEQKKSEASIKYLNRVLSVRSSINILIVRIKDREELFKEACNIAVQAGEFRMAMIVAMDPGTMLPLSITSSGKDKKILANIKKVMSSVEGMQKTLVAQAMRELKPVISNDAKNDPRLLFGKQYAEAGVNSMTVLPLIISGEAVGVLALYANEVGFFREEEMKLLVELADNIALAMGYLDKQDRINYLAYYDVLTGLANRTLFLERMTQYMRSAIAGHYRLALGLIDLERFKNINDSLGRSAGDSLLKQVAEWLIQFGQDDSLLARIGVDHFAFIVPEIVKDEQLDMLVEKLMISFRGHLFELNGTTFSLGLKIGTAVFPDDGSNVDILYRNAEAALKKAKLEGIRYLPYTQKMTEAVTYKLALENQLRRAIDNEEFVLHYQPKVDLMSGEVTGAEALIRWNDPVAGLVPPGKFIPTLEETGLIFEVGRWAMRQAVADWLCWRDAGLLPAMRIAVNVSSLQLRSLKFIDEVKEVLAIDAGAAAGLELEITESLIMQDIGPTTVSLEAIRALGISIAIDDFGTGYSSLNYLSRLAVDTLKIDRSFVIEMDKPDGRALVTSIIAMAHALKLKVVAEGVETERQMNQLLSLGCDEMQGFLFSKPVPADIFEARFLAPLAPADA
jgi:diguanylate cyclase (GGDEF)-like protein/PAS domain S-box-containing protein